MRVDAHVLVIARYHDYLSERADGDHRSKAYVLKGGIKQFLKEFEGNDDLIDHDS